MLHIVDSCKSNDEGLLIKHSEIYSRLRTRVPVGSASCDVPIYSHAHPTRFVLIFTRFAAVPRLSIEKVVICR
jgi:hypothetical protein